MPHIKHIIYKHKLRGKVKKRGQVPRDQNGFLNKVQSVKGVLDDQLHMLVVHRHS